jgi:hypothetical protein
MHRRRRNIRLRETNRCRRSIAMAETKYGHLLKTLKYEETDGEFMTMPNGADLEGIDLSFAWGYRRQPGIWGGDGGVGHAHPYGECLLFTGLDYDKPNSFDAEVEICMGEKGEKHIIDSPTVVILPPGFPHCPLITNKVDKPFGFMAISLSGEHKMSEVTPTGMPPSNRLEYGHLIKKMNLRDTKRTKGGNADFIEWWNGKDIDGFNLNFTWAFHTGLGAWHDKDPHVHPNDEVLLFVGCDPDNPDYLGAELSIGFEDEVHVFDKPTAVVAPKGVVHCPLITRRVDKPYCFSAISLNTEHETTWLGGEDETDQNS